MFKFDVRELNKAKDFGQLYLSNYKIFFMPNSVRDPQKARYFNVPYGMIYGYTAQASENKNQGTITIFCKDERSFKFRFETNIQMYRDTLKAIKQASQVQNHDLLYCHRAVAHMQAAAESGAGPRPKLINHEDVARIVSQEFERLAISTNPQRFTFFEHSRPENVLLPQVCYTAVVENEVQKNCTNVRKYGRVPTVVYVHPSSKSVASRSSGISGAIWRSSEPKAEMMTRTSDVDKQMIKMIANYHPEVVSA